NSKLRVWPSSTVRLIPTSVLPVGRVQYSSVQLFPSRTSQLPAMQASACNPATASIAHDIIGSCPPGTAYATARAARLDKCDVSRACTLARADQQFLDHRAMRQRHRQLDAFGDVLRLEHVGAGFGRRRLRALGEDGRVDVAGEDR